VKTGAFTFRGVSIDGGIQKHHTVDAITSLIGKGAV
jgi:hypothetical protein